MNSSSSIRVSDELRKELKILKAEEDFDSYDTTIRYYLDIEFEE